MVYVIDNKIAFNPEDNTLSLVDNSDERVSVSNPSRRILMLLIENQGRVVQREDFFKKVWDDFGLTASNNNLNHCISKLRKVVATLGYQDEFIITVPKVGFLIKKETAIVSVPDQSEQPAQEKWPEESAVAEPSVTVPDAEAECRPQQKKTKNIDTKENKTNSNTENKAAASRQWSRNTLKLIASGALLMLPVFCIILFYGQNKTAKEKFSIVNLGNCKLYSTSAVSPARKGEFIQLAKDFLLKQNISCDADTVLIFQSERFTSLINTGSVREFMAKCRVDQQSKITLCLSYYSNNRTTNAPID